MSPSISVKQTLGKRLKKLSLFSLEKRGRENCEFARNKQGCFYLFVLKEARGGRLGIQFRRVDSPGWWGVGIFVPPSTCPPGVIWRRLETFLVIMTGRGWTDSATGTQWVEAKDAAMQGTAPQQRTK